MNSLEYRIAGNYISAAKDFVINNNYYFRTWSRSQAFVNLVPRPQEAFQSERGIRDRAHALNNIFNCFTCIFDARWLIEFAKCPLGLGSEGLKTLCALRNCTRSRFNLVYTSGRKIYDNTYM